MFSNIRTLLIMESINITLTNDDIKVALDKILIKSDNKTDMIKLLSGFIQESSVGSSYFFKLVLGNTLPEMPKVGTHGFVLVSKLGYNIKKELYEDSIFCVQGYIPCEVIRTTSIHNYSPVRILLPDIGLLEGTKSLNEETGIEIKDFHINAEDLYDDLPI